MVHLHVKTPQRPNAPGIERQEDCCLPSRCVPCCSPLEPTRREGRERPLNLELGWASAEVHDGGRFSQCQTAAAVSNGGRLAIWVFPMSCRGGELCQQYCWCNDERDGLNGWLASDEGRWWGRKNGISCGHHRTANKQRDIAGNSWK